jgi:hypothetical protein
MSKFFEVSKESFERRAAARVVMLNQLFATANSKEDKIFHEAITDEILHQITNVDRIADALQRIAMELHLMNVRENAPHVG